MDFYNILLKLLVSFLRFGCVLLQFRGVHMKAMVCEMCNSNDLLKQDGLFVCQSCGTKYTVEEAKKLMGTVTIDRTEELENLFILARRARNDNNYENAEKYYEMITQISPKNWEAAFFQVYYIFRIFGKCLPVIKGKALGNGLFKQYCFLVCCLVSLFFGHTRRWSPCFFVGNPFSVAIKTTGNDKTI